MQIMSPGHAQPRAPRAGWTPDALTLQATLPFGPGVEIHALVDVDFAQPGGAHEPVPSSFSYDIVENGSSLQHVAKSAPITPAERASVQGVRDALAATAYLTD